MGLDFDTLFPGKFVKAIELKGRDQTVTIATVHGEELEGDKGKEFKCLISFVGKQKKWVVNKTNGLCLRAMFGRDASKWIGKRVTLYPAKIDFGDSDIAIRVRGSPDLAADLPFVLKLARKKPRDMVLKKTGAAPVGKQGTEPAPSPADPEASPTDLPPGVDDSGAPWSGEPGETSLDDDFANDPNP